MAPNALIDAFGNIWARRWVRFLIIGGVNTVLSYGVYALLVFIGLNYALASLCALVVGIFFSFRTHAEYVFRQLVWRRFSRYAIGWFAMYLLNTLIIWLLINAGFGAYTAGALAFIPVVMLSYLMQKLFVFRLEPESTCV